MPKTIKMRLSVASINNAIRELNDYAKWIEIKTKELIERVALVGAKEASMWFSSAIYDGVNDVHVTVGAEGDKWVIKANGQAVCFLEYGAGRYFNPSGHIHPKDKIVSGVVGIGEYGQGKGKRQGWVFYGDDGATFTRGNPPTAAMWRASEKMRNDLAQIARDVFGSK